MSFFVIESHATSDIGLNMFAMPAVPFFKLFTFCDQVQEFYVMLF